VLVGVAAVACVAIAGVLTAMLVGTKDKDSAQPTNVASTSPARTNAQQVQTGVSVPTTPTEPTTQTEPTPTQTEPTPTVPVRPQPSAATLARASIKQIIRRHWANIEAGHYAAAFAALAPGTQRRGTWIDAHQRDALTVARISLGRPRLTSPSTAIAPVITLHTEASSGCNVWSGHYEMRKSGGVWKIEKAKISNSPC
jgi:hypothetical protein